MNKGKIEQMGGPTEIYELPRTVFVANFLGQSNLIPGESTGTDGDSVVVSAHGMSFAVPSDRNNASGSSIVVGVRPEKLGVLPSGRAGDVPSGHNVISGRVTDASFTGVSTQYLVQAPWGQELTVFEQNLAVGERVATGDEVVVHWAPAHTFGLDPSEGLGAGVDPAVAEMATAAAVALAKSDSSSGG
jgi:spermidine/putrescine transport system ATP-binding protein